MEIISKANPIFIEIKELLKSNKNTSKVVVTDIAILDVLKKINKPVETLLYCPNLLHSELASTLLKHYEKHAKNIYEISEKTYLSLALKENAQGFLAVVPYSFSSLESLKDMTNILVVDGIETPGNLGTILRTAHCTKVDAIIDVDCKTSFTNPKTVASSRGTLFLLPIVRCGYKECNE